MAIKRRVVLSFPSGLVEEPITYHLIKDFDLMVNILKAAVRPKKEGRLVVEISGKKLALDKGFAYLTGLGVRVEPLAQEVVYDQDRCTHCTACIPICPTAALNIDRKQMKVSFKGEKCIICESCLPVCPYHAIKIKF
jgi:Fe-S-cluster-containing dehydrogenase component